MCCRSHLFSRGIVFLGSFNEFLALPIIQELAPLAVGIERTATQNQMTVQCFAVPIIRVLAVRAMVLGNVFLCGSFLSCHSWFNVLSVTCQKNR